MGKKKKPHGHYCRICGEYKANEKFSGKGHAAHICKACHSLPVAKRNEMENINKIDRMIENFFVSKDNLKRLKKYADDSRYPESSKYAKQALEEFYARMDDYHGNTPKEQTESVTYSELNEKLKKEVCERLNELIGEFLGFSDFLPDKDDRNEMLSILCEEIFDDLNYYDPVSLYGGSFEFDPNKDIDEKIQDFHAHMEESEEDDDLYEEPEFEPESIQKELVIDQELGTVFDEILRKVIAELKADGIEFTSYLDSLIITTTERLKIRKFISSDLADLHRIMKKPEVMYAWEHGFHKREVKTWVNKQISRYETDEYGYFAVTLKDTDKLIGQAGLIKSELNGEEIVEIGYIFDDTVWGQGYCTEAIKACVELAFEQFKIPKLYCTIRPENESSVKIAKRIGMILTGEFVKVYEGKEMHHLIFELESNRN